MAPWACSPSAVNTKNGTGPTGTPMFASKVKTVFVLVLRHVAEATSADIPARTAFKH